MRTGVLAAAQGSLGALLAEAGRVAEAIPHLEAALRIDPGDVAARQNLARAYALSGQTSQDGPSG